MSNALVALACCTTGRAVLAAGGMERAEGGCNLGCRVHGVLKIRGVGSGEEKKFQFGVNLQT